MTETPAQRLSAALSNRYRIERELGAGGMATVYLAEDLKHDRRVAIKVLRPELAAVIGAERFLTEIKTTAHLQHPHVLPLHDSGEVAGTVFYVMPYVEGESLRDRLTRLKQLPVEEAVRIAREVADALAYAHAQGVIHRDIKPENILLQGGHALVADFGIALAVSRSEGGERMTETGMSLGTPHYMSPEQAMGEREIRPAADVYALGCVLYEMLTGEPPFTGATAQAIVAKLLTTDPEAVTTLRRTVPANVDAALAKALQRLPADRFETAGGFAEALADPRFGEANILRSTGGNGRATAGVPPRRFYAALAASAALVVVAVLGWLRPQQALPTSAQQVVLWQHPLGRLLDPGVANEATQAAIAPDGSSVVFVDSTGGTFHLMRKLQGEPAATPMAGTDGALSPFFSPDGRWIGYITTDLKLKKVPVDGGGTLPLADVASTELGSSAAWLDDDSLVFLGAAGLSEISASGGPPRVLLTSDSMRAASVITMWPLPKSRGIVYTLCPGNCAVESSIHVLDLRSDSDKVLVPNAAGAWYSPTGHLLYTDHAGGLYAMGFDLDRLEATNGPIPVIPDVVPGAFTMSASGAVLYTTSTGTGSPSELMWVSRDGTAVPLDSTWVADFQYPALSPDGKSLAVSVVGATTQLWVRRSDGTRQQLTQDGAVNWRPAWTRDGLSIVFSSNRSGGAPGSAYDLYEQPVDGSAAARLLVDDSLYNVWEGQLSPDGRWLVARQDLPAATQIQAWRLAGDTALAPVRSVKDTLGGSTIALSPDGRWLAYYNNNPGVGSNNLEVVPFPALTPSRVVSHGGGTEPRWAPDGGTLFYRSGNRFMAVQVTPGPTLQFGQARELFSTGGYRSARNRQEYDVAPDGRHFVMIRDVPDTTAKVIYVENWLPELLARVKR